MSSQGRPKGEGTPMSPQGRPKGEYPSAQREGSPLTPLHGANAEPAIEGG